MDVSDSSSEKVIGFKDVTIMAVTANFGIRWIPVAACLGASAIFFLDTRSIDIFSNFSCYRSSTISKIP